MVMILKLFYIVHDNWLVVLLCKTVDGMRFVSIEGDLCFVADKFTESFQLGTIVWVSGLLCFLKLNLIQNDHISSNIDVD